MALGHIIRRSFKTVYNWIIFFNRSFIFASFAKIIEFKNTLNYLDPRKGEKLCDLGCGYGYNDILLSLTGARIYGVDIDRDTLNSAKNIACRLKVNVNYCLSDLNKMLGFKSRSFDKAVSYCVLEHLSDPENFLNEVNRILCPKGTLVLSVDSFSYGDIPDEFIDIHKRLCYVQKYYTIRDAEQLLNKCNFSIKKYSFIIKSPISTFFFKTLLRAYFRSEILGRSYSLKLFKLITPIIFLICVFSDSLYDDKHGGYWLTLLATKHK